MIFINAFPNDQVSTLTVILVISLQLLGCDTRFFEGGRLFERTAAVVPRWRRSLFCEFLSAR